MIWKRVSDVCIRSACGRYTVAHYDMAEFPCFEAWGPEGAPQDAFLGKHANAAQAKSACEHVFAHLGHLHSDAVYESPLMRVERHRHLAAPDAYASKDGWISGRGEGDHVSPRTWPRLGADH